MSYGTTLSLASLNDCGCDVFIYGPHLQSKLQGLSPYANLVTGDFPPTWVELKVRLKLPLLSLLVYLAFGSLRAACTCHFLNNVCVSLLSTSISLLAAWFWLDSTVREVSVLMSRPLGVQSSCRYLSGRWQRSALIPAHLIRTVHLIERVTNATVTPYLFLELRRSSVASPASIVAKSAPPRMAAASEISITSAATVGAEAGVTEEALSSVLHLQPLFCVPPSGREGTPCCLPLQSLAMIYRLAHAVLFRENVPAAI